MKKTTLALIITSLFWLTACGDKDDKTTQNPIPDTGTGTNPGPVLSKTTVNFDMLTTPKAPTLIIPTYMAMDDVDGTINARKLSTGPIASHDPIFALDQTDGWSTSLPIEINFTGQALDANSAANGFYLIKAGNPNDITDLTTPTQLKEGVDYRVEVKEKTLKIVLLKPLSPSSNYMFAITNAIKDIDGNPLAMNRSYSQLKQPSAQPSLQKITNQSEQNFAYIGVMKSDIVFTTWFTTASVGDVLLAAKKATELSIRNGAATVWKETAIAEGITPEQLNQLFKMSIPVPGGTTKLGKGGVYNGRLTLPYFLDITPANFLTSPWHSGMPNVKIINHTLHNGKKEDIAALTTQLIALGVETTELIQFHNDPEIRSRLITVLTGSQLTLADGQPLDSARIITRYNPIPTLKSVQEMEYSLIIPTSAQCQADKSNAVTIFLHGVTSDKNSLYTSELADKLIGDSCQALIAINLPLHGDRGVNGKNATEDPTIFINLDSLTTARDNLRQSTIDMVNLRASIGLIFKEMTQNSATSQLLGKLGLLNPNQPVSFVGHSLGAMIGTSLGNIANRAVSTATTEQLLFAIDKIVLANPGGQIPYLLMNSRTFNVPIKASMEVIANPDFIPSCGTVNYLLCYAALESRLVHSSVPSDRTKLASMYQTFRHYSRDFQNILDTIDPINHAPLIPKTTAVLLTQIKNDLVIPNFVQPNALLSGTDILLPNNEFTGTKPMIDLLNLTPLNSSVENKLIRHAGLFNAGVHMSLFFPKKSAAVTNEMQSQIHSFIIGDGRTIIVTDPSVLDQ